MLTIQTVHLAYVQSFLRDFRLKCRVGVANLQSREGVGVGGRGWYRSKERY